MPAAALACLLAPARSAWALDVSVGQPRERNGYVIVDARLDRVLPERIRESLGRGMPATLELRTELWRRRDGWFDRLESGYDASVRIRYDVWSDRYRLESPAKPALLFETLDSLEREIERAWTVPPGRVGTIHPGSRYYVVAYATLRPLSVEDVEEVEGWLSGEVRAERRAGLGILTELPRSVFDAVRNFAGFGDQRARAVSEEFDLRDLFP